MLVQSAAAELDVQTPEARPELIGTAERLTTSLFHLLCAKGQCGEGRQWALDLLTCRELVSLLAGAPGAGPAAAARRQDPSAERERRRADVRLVAPAAAAACLALLTSLAVVESDAAEPAAVQEPDLQQLAAVPGLAAVLRSCCWELQQLQPCNAAGLQQLQPCNAAGLQQLAALLEVYWALCGGSCSQREAQQMRLMELLQQVAPGAAQDQAAKQLPAACCGASLALLASAALATAGEMEQVWRLQLVMDQLSVISEDKAQVGAPAAPQRLPSPLPGACRCSSASAALAAASPPPPLPTFAFTTLARRASWCCWTW
jgi:hypothetical protein